MTAYGKSTAPTATEQPSSEAVRGDMKNNRSAAAPIRAPAGEAVTRGEMPRPRRVAKPEVMRGEMKGDRSSVAKPVRATRDPKGGPSRGG